MKKPERIYLVSPDISEEEDAGPGMGSDHEGVYWCEDQIHASDVLYIRADLATAAPSIDQFAERYPNLRKALEVDSEGFMREWERFERGTKPHPEDIAGNLTARDREADRARFTDPQFNRWLDEGISDAGHTVWDAVGDVQAAWQGWTNRPYYDATPAPKGLAEVRATLLHLAKACNARGFDSLIDSSLSQKFWYGLRDEGYAAIEVLDALAQPQSADDQAQDD